ncbi:MAG: hypothetical protein PF448_11985 [Bacteroidales bacterium]|jgi:uncharacterized membrane protein|nr:hypothetical protein [Bacteroidales bacterium]
MKQEIYKSTRIIHFSLLLGMIFFGFTVALLNDFQFPNQPYDDIFLIVNTTMLLFIPAGLYIRKYKINKISPNASKTTRYGEIRSANIILWALINGTGLYSITAILLIYHYFHLIYALICVIALIITRPKPEMFD